MAKKPRRSRSGKAPGLAGAKGKATPRRVASSAAGQAPSDALEQRTRELKEALAFQAATSDVLRIISRSRTELQPVLDAIAKTAAELCRADGAFMWRLNGDTFYLAAMNEIDTEFGNFARDNPLPLDMGTSAGRCVLEGRTIHIPDALQDPDYRWHGDQGQKIGGFRSLLGVPLMRDNVKFGAFALFRRVPEPFTEKQIELVTTFADQAVIAIENARLFNELQESLEYQTATNDVLSVISRSPNDVRPVFKAIVDSARQLCEAEFSTAASYDGELLHLAAANNLSPNELAAYEKLFPRAVNRSFAMGRAVLDRKTVHIDDVNADPDYDPRTLDILQTAGQYHTIMGVPVLRKGEPVGVIGLVRREVRPFTERQIALVETFAEQAVIAIENARLFNDLQTRTDELTEAIEQQTVMSEILQVISNSPTDSQPVFDAIVQSGLALFGDAAISIALPDGDIVKAVAINESDRARADAWRARFPIPLTRKYMHSTAILEARIIDIPDVRNPPPELAVGAKNFAESGYRAITIVPMMRGDIAIGALSIVRDAPGSLTEKQLALVKTFADQAVIAIENARLFNDLQTRTDELTEALEQQTAMSEILQVISNSPTDTQPVFDSIVQCGLKLFPDALISVALRDGELVEAAAIADRDPVRVEAWRRTIFHTPLKREYMHGAAILDRRIVDIPDVADAPAEFSQGAQNFLTSGYRAITIMPMLRGDEAIGLLSVVRLAPGPLSGKQVGVLRTFAAQAVIAIENATAFAEIQNKSRQLGQQSAELAEWNRTLESRVSEQVDQLGRMTKLTRFLSPKITSLIMSGEADDPFKTRRAEITVVYVDLRGFTAFTETTDPEEVMAVLRQYHAELGKAITAHDGTIEHFAGDGAMILFNAPMPMENHELQAIRMTLQIRQSVGALAAGWRKRGFNLGFGAGIAGGYATMGTIGFAERLDYSAIGIVCNLSARLCSEATDGQILISPRVFVKVEDQVEAESMGELTLKGFHRPVAVYNLLGLRASEAA